MNKLRMSDLNRGIVGHWVTFRWNDIGCQDGVIVNILDDGKITKGTSLKVYVPQSRGACSIIAEQLVDVRGYMRETD